MHTYITINIYVSIIVYVYKFQIIPTIRFDFGFQNSKLFKFNLIFLLIRYPMCNKSRIKKLSAYLYRIKPTNTRIIKKQTEYNGILIEAMDNQNLRVKQYLNRSDFSRMKIKTTVFHRINQYCGVRNCRDDNRLVI